MQACPESADVRLNSDAYVIRKGVCTENHIANYVKRTLLKGSPYDHSSKVCRLLIIKLPCFLRDTAGAGTFAVVPFPFDDVAFSAEHLVFDIDLRKYMSASIHISQFYVHRRNVPSGP